MCDRHVQRRYNSDMINSDGRRRNCELSVINAIAQAMNRSLDLDEALQVALGLAQTNLEEARRSVMDMRAAPLDGLGLVEALAVLVADMSDREEVRIDLDITGGGRPLRAALEVGIYRLVQEAVANIVRHADARMGSVYLNIGTDLIRPTIEDDGRGFDVEGVVENRFGLLGMNERVRLLGGVLQVESAPGRGTRVEARLPLSPKLPAPPSVIE